MEAALLFVFLRLLAFVILTTLPNSTRGLMKKSLPLSHFCGCYGRGLSVLSFKDVPGDNLPNETEVYVLVITDKTFSADYDRCLKQ